MLTGWTAFWVMMGFIVCFMTLYFCVIRFVINTFERKGIIKSGSGESISSAYSSRFTLEQIRQFERVE